MGHQGAVAAVIGTLARVPVDRQRRLLWFSVALAANLLLVITLLGGALRTGAAPLGIVSLQFAASPEAAQRMLESWASVPRARLLWAHGLDLILPFAYALSIGLAAVRVSAGARTALGASRIASGAALTAASADQVENVAMGLTILVGPSWGGVLVTLVAATVKSVLLVLAVGALVAASTAGGRPRAGAR